MISKNDTVSEVTFEYFPLKHKDLLWFFAIVFVLSIQWINYLSTTSNSTLFSAIVITNVIIYVGIFIFLFGISFIAISILELGYLIRKLLLILRNKQKEFNFIVAQSIIWIIVLLIFIVAIYIYLFILS